MKMICSVLGSVLAIATASAQLPPLELPAGAGVNIHFVRGHEKDLDMIAAAGFKFIRMDFGWEGIERQKGAYDWSAYDELTAISMTGQTNVLQMPAGQLEFELGPHPVYLRIPDGWSVK